MGVEESRSLDRPTGASGRRRAAAGGYSCGAERRGQILRAAVKVFGEEGYARASTRRIAREARIQPPALQYYFESKEGLIRACAEEIVEDVRRLAAAAMEQAEAAARTGPPEAALDALCVLLGALADASLGRLDAPERARFFSRMQSEESPASEILRARVGEPLETLALGLVARVLERPVDETVRLRTGLVVSQLSALHILQEGTLRLLGWPDFEGARGERIKAMIEAHTRAALQA